MAGKKRQPGGPKKAAGKSEPRADAEAFVEGVIARGEAVKRVGRKAKLPPGATHEIVGEDEEGRPKLRRRRFSTT